MLVFEFDLSPQTRVAATLVVSPDGNRDER